MALIPYAAQWLDRRDRAAVARILRGPFLTQGPEVGRFERALASAVGARHCVAVSSGTAALHLSVAALGLRKGAEGITSTNSFVASANALVYNGLVPVLADIDPETYNVSVEDLERRIGPKTKVLIPVHFAGRPADMEAIGRLARRGGLRVIEDASHALGSRCEDGSRVGSCRRSDMTVFSFHPVKTITTGEGGAVTTNDRELYERLVRLRTHGITREAARLSSNPGPWHYEMQELGFNYRLTDIQAALGVSQLRRLPSFGRRRREIVSRYNTAFKGLPGVSTPRERPGRGSVFHLYVLQVDFERLAKSRARVMAELRARGVGTQVHYIPIHLQPYYRRRFGCRPGQLPAAEAFFRRALSLPLYPKMSDAEVSRVVGAVRAVLSSRRQGA